VEALLKYLRIKKPLSLVVNPGKMACDSLNNLDAPPIYLLDLGSIMIFTIAFATSAGSYTGGAGFNTLLV
jgi:hypothetical protein